MLMIRGIVRVALQVLVFGALLSLPIGTWQWPRALQFLVAMGSLSLISRVAMARAGMMDREQYLASLSSVIGRLQESHGRLVQSLERASLDVWTSGNQGVRGTPSTVSYYGKGPVVSFLLDARIRTATNGQRTFEDVIRLAYERYGGERGFTAEGFQATAEEVAGEYLE